MNEIAVVQGLQAEVGELQIPLRQDGRAEGFQVEARCLRRPRQFRRQQLQLHPPLDVGGEAPRVEGGHVFEGGAACEAEEAERLRAQTIQQQPGRRVGIVRVFFNQGARGADQRGAEFLPGHPVVKVAQGFVDDLLAADILEPGASLRHDGVNAVNIQRRAAAVGLRNMDALPGPGACGLPSGAPCRRLRGRPLGPLAGVLFPVDHIAAGGAVFPGPHQDQFHLVLNILDVEGAAGGHAALESGADLPGQLPHNLAHPGGRGGGAPFGGEKGFGDGDGDFAVIIGHHGAVALDDPKLAGRGDGDVGSGRGIALDGGRDRGLDGGGGCGRIRSGGDTRRGARRRRPARL